MTRTQYTNWATPDRTRKTRKESISFRREDVASRYVFQRVLSASADVDTGAGAEEEVEWETAGAGLAGLDAPAVVAATEACFGVLGPGILSVFAVDGIIATARSAVDGRRWAEPTCELGAVPRVPLGTALRGLARVCSA